MSAGEDYNLLLSDPTLPPLVRRRIKEGRAAFSDPLFWGVIRLAAEALKGGRRQIASSLIGAARDAAKFPQADAERIAREAPASMSTVSLARLTGWSDKWIEARRSTKTAPEVRWSRRPAPGWVSRKRI